MKPLTLKQSLATKALFSAVCLGIASTASAQTTINANSSTNPLAPADWNTAATWSGNAVPVVRPNDSGSGNGNTVNIGNGSVRYVNLNGAGTTNQLNIASGTGTGVLTVGSGGNLNLAYYVREGGNANGQITMGNNSSTSILNVVNGGQVTVVSHMNVGNGTGANATVNVGAGSSLSVGGQLRIGSQGNAADATTTKLAVTGAGSVIANNIYVGYTGGSGPVNGANATLSVSGTGATVHSTAVFSFRSNGTLEFNIGADGVSTVTGGANGFDIQSGATLDLNFLAGITAADLQTSSILLLDVTGTGNNAKIVGTFSNVDWGNLNPAQWELVYSEKQLHLNYNYIPEPGTYAAIFGVVALGAIVIRRRRRA